MVHYHRRVRSAFVHEETIELLPGADAAAPRAAVTVELCGHWEHDGVCRWPHHTVVDNRVGQSIQVRTVFACPAAEVDGVRQRITAALDSGRLAAGSRESRWTTTRQGAATIEPSEQTLAAQLVAG
jgi:hypothetical protein